jgi:dTDP-4-dehydrorhamnose reductase
VSKRRGGQAEKCEQDVLILGAAGQVGQELTRVLPEEYRLPRAREMVDVTDQNAVRSVIESVRPKVVVNLAATNPVTDADDWAHWQVNAFAVDHLVKTCALNGASLIHFSASDVFGASRSKEPHGELSPVCPKGSFASSKAAGEHAILALAQYPAPEFLNFRYWIIRCSLLIGRPTQFFHNWFNVKLEEVLRGRTPVLLPHDVLRSATYVPHLVEHLVWLINNHQDVPPGIYHIANSGGPSLYQMVNEARLSIDSRSPIELHGVGLNHLRSTSGTYMCSDEVCRNGVLDCSRWSDVCPLEMPSWRAAVDDFCRDYRSRQWQSG